jgi:hypothetical protein
VLAAFAASANAAKISRFPVPVRVVRVGVRYGLGAICDRPSDGRDQPVLLREHDRVAAHTRDHDSSDERGCEVRAAQGYLLMVGCPSRS